jgi:hypothetical protein
VLARDAPDGGKKSALPLSTPKAVPQLQAGVEWEIVAAAPSASAFHAAYNHLKTMVHVRQ